MASRRGFLAAIAGLVVAHPAQRSLSIRQGDVAISATGNTAEIIRAMRASLLANADEIRRSLSVLVTNTVAHGTETTDLRAGP